MARTAPPPVQLLPAIRVVRRYNYTQKPGRPRKYETPGEFSAAVEEYFESCWETTHEPRQDVDGPYIEEVRRRIRPDTITGLAVHLGMTREALLYFENADVELLCIIKAAKLRCQAYAEEQVFRTQGQVAGPIFNLKANYGWKETSVKEITGPDGVSLFADKEQADARAKAVREQMLAELGD